MLFYSANRDSTSLHSRSNCWISKSQMTEADSKTHMGEKPYVCVWHGCDHRVSDPSSGNSTHHHLRGMHALCAPAPQRCQPDPHRLPMLTFGPTRTCALPFLCMHSHSGGIPWIPRKIHTGPPSAFPALDVLALQSPSKVTSPSSTLRNAKLHHPIQR